MSESMKTIGPFGSGAVLKTDGEKIVERVEAPAFKFGSVYRQQDGTVVRLIPITWTPHREKWESKFPGHVFAEASQQPDGFAHGYVSLVSGCYVQSMDCDLHPQNLLPGELELRDGTWVEVEAKPEIDPLFAAAHFQDGRDLRQEEEPKRAPCPAPMRGATRATSLSIRSALTSLSTPTPSPAASSSSP